MAGIYGTSLDANGRELIENYHVGGIIFFSRNFEGTQQMLQLVREICGANRMNKVPLFLAVDEEGGSVTRFPDSISNLPSSRSIADTGDISLARTVGNLMGEKLAAFGLNLNFAPVLDIQTNPDNPVIGDRSFGSDPETVKKYGIEVLMGIRERNVMPVIKHFPGHGDTSVDSHIGLPVVDNGISRLMEVEWVPFAAAIRDGADAVMIAHILLPQIDAVYPASLSKTVITDQLRGLLGFNGVVFTDDLTMGAITNWYEVGEAAVQSILAGADVILICHSFERQLEALSALRKAVMDGIISEERINESLLRILRLKQKYQLDDEVPDSADVSSLNEKINSINTWSR